MGSNPAGVFEDAMGERYYVKFLESSAHARSEMLAARLYELAGAPTFTYVRTRAPDQVATKLVRLDKKHVSRLSDDERRDARRWFGVHAWTANWDAAGFDGDNQGVVDGTVLTLDLGGALEFRAQGYPKGKAFGTQVGELTSLRTNSDNPYAQRLFGEMDEDELRRAVQTVVRLPDELVRGVIIENGGSIALADKMVARKNDMARRMLEATNTT